MSTCWLVYTSSYKIPQCVPILNCFCKNPISTIKTLDKEVYVLMGSGLKTNLLYGVSQSATSTRYINIFMFTN